MNKPIIGIVMGSDSDLPVMQAAAKTFEEFGIPYELTIVSAHRTPERMYEYAKAAYGRGIRIIIAGAGGAAHLPGMIAAISAVPVIGVPVQSKAMSGIDSLYSIVQMPPGVPVATVAINGAQNAALLAIEMLGIQDPKMYKKMLGYKEELKKMVEKKAMKLEKGGYKEYLSHSGKR